jgi:4-hydroxy-4-methyl-2-oxoglutarate aldolase
VVVVGRTAAQEVLAACRAREEKEAGSRVRYRNGELGLDVNRMRGRLAEKGLTYVEYDGTTGTAS